MTGREVPDRVRTGALALARRLRTRADQSESGPRAVYAAILDGEVLWLSVLGMGAGGQLALRHRGSGETIVPDFVTVDEPGHSDRSGFMDLLPHAPSLGAVTAGPKSHELVVLDSAAAEAVAPVRYDGTRPKSPIGIGRSSDERWSFGLTCDGTVVVSAVADAPGPGVHELAIDGGDLIVTFSSPFPPSGLLIVDKGGEQVGQVPVARTETDEDLEVYVARIGDADVAIAEKESVRLEVAFEGGNAVLRRRHADVTNPGTSVVLPKLTGGVSQEQVLNITYGRDGHLGIRRQAALGRGPALS